MYMVPAQAVNVMEETRMLQRKSWMRWGRCSVALLLTLFAGGSPSRAQSPSAAQAQTVLNGCATAMGAAQGELPIVAQGTLTASGEQAPRTVTIKTHGRRLFRQDQTTPGRDGESWVINNGEGFRLSGSQKEKMASHVVRYFRPEHLPALSCTPDLNKVDVAVAGQEQVNGRAVHHLKLVTKPLNAKGQGVEAALSEYHAYIDTQTLMVLKTSSFVFSPTNLQNRSVWETYYSDYRNVHGMLVPFHVENYLDGQKIQDIVFSDVQVGMSLSNAEFE
jgi:hypothetical protein